MVSYDDDAKTHSLLAHLTKKRSNLNISMKKLEIIILQICQINVLFDHLQNENGYIYTTTSILFFLF